jgi:hypothetical protein
VNASLSTAHLRDILVVTITRCGGAFHVKRFLLFSVLISVAVAVLAASAPAVEVTVKSDTELYDNAGKVIQEATAGQRFKAKKASGEWAYGFLTLSTGGANGWIKLEALELDNNARRKLGLPPGADEEAPDEPQSDSILLRYALEPDELLVYEASAKLEETAKGKAGNRVVDADVRVLSQIGLSIQCTGKRTAELRCHKYILDVDARLGENTVELTGNAETATLYRNGKFVYSGKWGVRELAGLPDASRPFGSLIRAAFDERGASTGEVGIDPLAQAARLSAGASFAPPMIFPEQSAHTGSSWEHSVKVTVPGPMNTPTIPLVGTVTCRLQERTTQEGRRCARIVFTGVVSQDESAADRQAIQNMTGSYLIDEENGITLSARLMSSLTVKTAVENIPVTLKRTCTITVQYAGDTLEEQ